MVRRWGMVSVLVVTALAGVVRGGPVIEVHPRLLELGEAYLQETVEGAIEVRNTGDEPLAILGIHRSCGCTVTALKEEDKTIAPGGSVRIGVTVKPDRIPADGKFRREVTIISNASNEPEAKVAVVVVVRVALVAEPAALVVSDLELGRQQRLPLTVRSGDGRAFRIESAQVGQEGVRVEFDAEREADEHKLQVLVGPFQVVDTYATRLVLHTTHPRQARLEVPVLVSLRRVVRLEPAALNLGLVAPGSVVRKRVRLHREIPEPIRRLEVQVLAEGDVQCRVEPVAGEPDTWDLVFLVGPAQPPGSFRSGLLFRTDVARVGQFKGYVSMYVRPPRTQPAGGAER